MAVALLSTVNTSLTSRLFSLNSSSSPSPAPSFCSLILPPNHATPPQKLSLCRALRESPVSNDPLFTTKRNLSFGITATLLFSLAGNGNENGSSNANAAILEPDDDVELLERVKKDRQKRIEKQGVINSSKQETGYLQDLVYKLSEVGQAIEKNDLSSASSVLGPNTETEWIKKANSAFSKLTSSPEEKAEVDTFNSSIAKLITAVGEKDVELSKIAFVSSASAFEKWSALTGLSEKLRGL